MGGTRGWGSHNKRRLFIVRAPPTGRPRGGAPTFGLLKVLDGLEPEVWY